MAKLTYAQVSELLNYDPETGKLYWKYRPEHLFVDRGKASLERQAKIWNKRYAGTEAFTYVNAKGYRVGRIFKRSYRSQHIIWMLVFGEWPTEQIDHINGKRDDNRLVNLREVTVLQNARNRKVYSINRRSMIPGVIWKERDKKWVVYIGDGGKMLWRGSFHCIAKARAERKAAEIEYGYHPNHGRVAA